jgi:hypothetical protein
MSDAQNKKHEEVLGLIRSGIEKAGGHVKNYRRWDFALLIIGIVFGVLATIITGGTAIGGEPVMKSLGGWRAICAVAAVFTGIATVCGTIHKTFQLTARTTAAIDCNAKLKALELSLIISEKDPLEVAESYNQILKEHSESLI